MDLEVLITDTDRSVGLPMTRKRIGEQLLAAGLLTEAQLEAALDLQKNAGGFLGDVLVRMGFVSADLVGEVLSANMRVPYVNLVKTYIDPKAIAMIDEDYQRSNFILGYKASENQLLVAMRDPMNVMVVDRLELMTGHRVTPALAMNDDLQAAYGRTFTVKSSTKRMLSELAEAEKNAAEEQDISSDQLFHLAEDAPIVRLVNTIIAGAVSQRASDIHIEPNEHGVSVRYRMDGVLYDQMTYARSLHNAVVSRVKITANMNIAERRRPQDGRIAVRTEGYEIDMRVSTMLMAHGEKVVMRILDKSEVRGDLDTLGFHQHQLDTWKSMLGRSHGMILATGPTGSGKSTTLYASLSQINSSSLNIITVEDPIEYTLSGVNQSQVNPKIGVDFASALRTIVRQDPDVIMVGEIRDRETAEIAVQAALTGHLVFSTLHTNDAPGALVRLAHLGVEPFLLTSAIIGALAQRLLRKACSECSVLDTPDADVLDVLRITPRQLSNANLRRSIGCPRCAGTGYKGRIAVFEVVPMTNALRRALRQGEDGSVLKQIAKADGMSTMLDAGVLHALAGSTTLEEVCRVLLSGEGEEDLVNELALAA